MDLSLFGGWSSATSVLVKVVIFYFYAVLLLRLAGKRTIATTTVFDFVSTVAMGTIIGTTIISSSIALSDGIVGLTALVGLQGLVAYASTHSARVHRITTNTPRLLYDGSRFLDDNLRSERVTREEVKSKIRQRGHSNLESVAAVVFESTGDMAVVDSSVPARPAEPDETIMGPVQR